MLERAAAVADEKAATYRIMEARALELGRDRQADECRMKAETAENIARDIRALI